MTGKAPRNNHTDAGSVLQQAMDLHRLGDLFEADLLYRRALDADPDNAQALRLRGILARDRGEPGLSIELLRQAHAATPNDPEPLSETGLSYMAAGEFALAEEWLRRALTVDPEATTPLANLGALLHHRGHVAAAADCYRQTLNLDAEDVAIRCNLAKALADAGDITAAINEAMIAIEDSDGHPHALATHGAILTDAGQYAEASHLLAAATRLEPHDDMALVNLALCYAELGDTTTAANTLQQALDANPYNARAVADLSNCMTALGNIADALDLCSTFLRQHPGERLVVGAQALALHNAGETHAAQVLTDCAALVQIYELPCPAGFTSTAAFTAQLADVIRADSSLLTNPVSKSTYGGDQTGELDLQAHPALTAFGELVDQVITDAAHTYTAAGLKDHPVMLPASDAWTIRAWGTVLRAGGQQTPHMHPLGWLSGVCYIELPDAMGAAGHQSGWLEFGRPPERLFRAGDPDIRSYEPARGRLMLFPSWFWHQTVPFTGAGERISIAFDVLPKAGLRML
jgi:uncharacterized protein (TIGR02466 family)